MANSPECSTQYSDRKDEEGHKGIFRPSVLEHLPLNLWGRDILQAMGVVLTTKPVQHTLADQGFSPAWGWTEILRGNAGLQTLCKGLEWSGLVVAPRKCKLCFLFSI